MLLRKRLFLTLYLLGTLVPAIAQRSYKSHSVLASSNWYQLSVTAAGVYKLDLAFLNKLGLNLTNLSSQSVQLFGNGGQMLAEANNGQWLDDLQENAIMVIDGGDGILNGSDHILFYALGPEQWLKDSANQRFIHQKNIYTDKSFYYLRIGSNGKRIPAAPGASSPTIAVTSFSGRYFHELDTVNFLNSGKDWYGEEFSSMPGRALTRNFPVTISNVVSGSQLTMQTTCVARSAGAGSFFDVKMNNVLLGRLNIQPVGTGPYDQFAHQTIHLANAVLMQENNNIGYTYTPGSFNAQGWLNWFELFYRQQLSLKNLHQLQFRDWASVGNHTAEFIITEASGGSQVWDITDPLIPVSMPSTITGGTLRFLNNCSRLREYIVFKETNLLTPVAEGRIANQDLHAIAPVDYIIVVYPPFLLQAQRLAKFHEQRNGLRSLVVTIDQIYHEFAGGNPDPVGVRDFVKMYYDKYKTDPANKLRYLLLFGDASYDYKNRLTNNTNFVPSWQSSISLDVLSTCTSDDFFGFLDDTEDINSGVASNYLDIGIGRIPAKNIDEAKNFVDKVEAYFDTKSYGPWRTNLTFIADDEDQNLHLQDAEQVSSTVATTAPLFDLQKIYLDAYQQESGSGGSRYPTVNQAINNQVFAGTLIWNFNGHGNPQRLTEETILDQDIVNSWNNPNRLPLFITATCDFAPYDNPLINSIGENILVRPKTGGIALMTTTRTVFAFSNRIMNDNYLKFALEPDANGKYRSLGDAVKEAKNYTYQSSADITNNRKFTLLGDPALTLAFPTIRARPTTINGKIITQTDTLSATEKIILEGVVTDLSGNLLPQFNGNIYATIFDKPKQVTTLANDPGSTKTSFGVQSNILFKGKATVTAGKFAISFRVPKDINYQYGKGKLSLYAEDGSGDGSGYFSNFLVGGTANDLNNDKEGPEIKPFLNDEKFVSGSVTNELPVLILKLADSSGINTVGTGIGHDIIATLDNDNNRFFILNDFYEGELNSFQKGNVRFQLPELEPGPHSLKIKAWDTMNNSSEVVLEFVVAKDEELSLQHVLNYPNPFTSKTQFWFEHNKPGQNLQVRLQIFTLSGRVIKTMQKAINTTGNRSSELEWDGRDEYGDRVGKGVYFYKLTVIAPGRLKKEKIEKLVIF